MRRNTMQKVTDQQAGAALLRTVMSVRGLASLGMVLLLLVGSTAAWAVNPVTDVHGHPVSAIHAADTEMHGEVLHDGGHAPAAASSELPNLITIALKLKINGKTLEDVSPATAHFLHVYEYQIFAVFIAFVSALFIFGTLRLRAERPGKMQAFLEMVVEGFYTFVISILGERGKKYVPFFASLFMFIWLNNMFGIIPLFTGATSKLQTTGTLAAFVFFYVNFYGLVESGPWAFFKHMCGSPEGVLQWVIGVVLIFPGELIGLFAKPLSLALRLFGNIMGEHILSGVFLMLGISLMTFFWPSAPVGIPLHLPFLFLSLLVGTIQALVFTLLGMIYLLMVLPHEHDDHHGHAVVVEEH